MQLPILSTFKMVRGASIINSVLQFCSDIYWIEQPAVICISSHRQRNLRFHFFWILWLNLISSEPFAMPKDLNHEKLRNSKWSDFFERQYFNCLHMSTFLWQLLTFTITRQTNFKSVSILVRTWCPVFFGQIGASIPSLTYSTLAGEARSKESIDHAVVMFTMKVFG